MDMPGSGRIWLNFRERTVLAENRKRFEKDFVVRAGGPVGEVVHHEVWAEEIGPIASGAVALRGAGKIELRKLQKFAFDFEPRVERRFGVFRDKRSEEIRPHAGVEILADLQGDFDFLREGRRNMLRDLILWQIGARRGRKIGGGGIGGGLDLNTCSDQGFTEHRFCELCGRRYGY